MIVGEEYICDITARAADRDARSAFQQWVLGAAKPGSTIFDFGAGPGIDAKFYAERGFQVAAYDVDPRMCAAFLRYCRNQIALKQVILFEGSYRNFLESPPPCGAGRVDVVTSNFAPISLIDDPHELFGKFHEMTASQAKVLISVLNPYCLSDARYGWWWRHVAVFGIRGHTSVPGTQGNIHRRSARNLEHSAAGYFRLTFVSGGLRRRFMLLGFDKC